MSDFWFKESSWPIDAPGYVFLARAVHALGRNTYGLLWTGREPLPQDNLLPEFTDPSSGPLSMTGSPHWIKRRLNDLLARKKPESGRQIMALQRRTDPAPFSYGEWAAAIKLAREEDTPLAEGVRRMQTIQATLRAAFVGGELKSYLRAVKGGGFSEALPGWVWNTENLRPRFTMCRMNPNEPFSIAFAGDNFHYVYVDAEDLQKMLQPKPVENGLLAGLFSPKAVNAAKVDGDDDVPDALPVQCLDENIEADHVPPARPMTAPDTGSKMPTIGRPGKQELALEAYNKLFPKGHSGATWKVVAREIEKATGEKVSQSTLKRAIADRG